MDFRCIKPLHQVGSVKVLNLNTLGHSSLRRGRGSVSGQTSYFLSLSLSLAEDWSSRGERARERADLNQFRMQYVRGRRVCLCVRGCLVVIY